MASGAEACAPRDSRAGGGRIGGRAGRPRGAAGEPGARGCRWRQRIAGGRLAATGRDRAPRGAGAARPWRGRPATERPARCGDVTRRRSRSWATRSRAAGRSGPCAQARGRCSPGPPARTRSWPRSKPRRRGWSCCRRVRWWRCRRPQSPARSRRPKRSRRVRRRSSRLLAEGLVNKQIAARLGISTSHRQDPPRRAVPQARRHDPRRGGGGRGAGGRDPALEPAPGSDHQAPGGCGWPKPSTYPLGSRTANSFMP